MPSASKSIVAFKENVHVQVQQVFLEGGGGRLRTKNEKPVFIEIVSGRFLQNDFPPTGTSKPTFWKRSVQKFTFRCDSFYVKRTKPLGLLINFSMFQKFK